MKISFQVAERGKTYWPCSRPEAMRHNEKEEARFYPIEHYYFPVEKSKKRGKKKKEETIVGGGEK